MRVAPPGLDNAFCCEAAETVGKLLKRMRQQEQEHDDFKATVSEHLFLAEQRAVKVADELDMARRDSEEAWNAAAKAQAEVVHLKQEKSVRPHVHRETRAAGDWRAFSETRCRQPTVKEQLIEAIEARIEANHLAAALSGETEDMKRRGPPEDSEFMEALEARLWRSSVAVMRRNDLSDAERASMVAELARFAHAGPLTGGAPGGLLATLASICPSAVW